MAVHTKQLRGPVHQAPCIERNVQTTLTPPQTAEGNAAPETTGSGSLLTVRLLVWTVLLAVGLVFYRISCPWAWRAPAFATFYTVASLILARSDRRVRAVPIVDLAVDALAATVVVSSTGGFGSPLVPLYFVVIGEGYTLFGQKGAIGAATAAAMLITVNFSPSMTVQEAVLRGVGAAILLAASLALTPAATIAMTRRRTILEQRNIEELDRQLEELEADYRLLRANYREVTSAARDQRTKIADTEAELRMLAATVTGSDAEGLHERALQTLADLFDARSAVLWLMSPNHDGLKARAAVGASVPELRDVRVEVEVGAPASVVRRACENALGRATNLPVIVVTDEEPQPSDIIDAVAIQGPTILATVIRKDDQILGVVTLSGTRHGGFSRAEAERLAGLAGTIGLAVVNVEERVRLSQCVREISVLHEIGALAHSADESRDLYAAVVSLINKSLHPDQCAVYALDDTKTQLEECGSCGSAVRLIESMVFPDGQGVSGWLSGSQKAILVGDVEKELQGIARDCVPNGVRSCVIVPMALRNNVLGAITVASPHPYAFTQYDQRVLSVLAVQAAVTIERHKMLRSLEHMAITDGLTELYNHRYFQLRINSEVQRALRYDLRLSMLMIDVDNFKHVNDTHGHATGDMILAELAQVLKRNVRETEIVARYGGEEFAVLLPQTSARDASVAAERVRQRIERHTFRTSAGGPIHVTVSIGIADLSAGMTARHLVSQTDAAMYCSKRHGRNRICIAEASECTAATPAGGSAN